MSEKNSIQKRNKAIKTIQVPGLGKFFTKVYSSKKIKQKRKDFLEAINAFKDKQRASSKAAKKVRCITITHHSLTISDLLTMLSSYTSSTSSRAQIKIEQATLRFAKPYPVMSQMSPGFASQRKLLRIKNSSNKRHGVEQLHYKVKARKRADK